MVRGDENKISYLLGSRGGTLDRCTLKGTLFDSSSPKSPVLHDNTLLSPLWPDAYVYNDHQMSISLNYLSNQQKKKHTTARTPLWCPLSATQNQTEIKYMQIWHKDPRRQLPYVCVIRINGLALWGMHFNARDLINGDWR